LVILIVGFVQARFCGSSTTAQDFSEPDAFLYRIIEPDPANNRKSNFPQAFESTKKSRFEFASTGKTG